MLALSLPELGLLLAALGLVAFLYSSVGHGGATGYLAVLALAGLAPAEAKPGVLWLNCLVAGIAFVRFCAAGHFAARLFLWLAVASVPCAWLGSRLAINPRQYALALGCALVAATVALVVHPREGPSQPFRPALAVALGGALGLLAGATGIGGGVFLTPVLVFLHWVPTRTAGGVSAAFIVVNSIAGLCGTAVALPVWHLWHLAAAAVGAAGALLGSRLGATRWAPPAFRRALAFVLLIAGAKLLWLAGR